MDKGKFGKVMRTPREMVSYLEELNKQTGIPIPDIMRKIAEIKPITAERRR